MIYHGANPRFTYDPGRPIHAWAAGKCSAYAVDWAEPPTNAIRQAEEEADVLICDFPTRGGMELFAERAGTKPQKVIDLALASRDRIHAWVEATGGAVFVAGEKTTARILWPDFILRFQLNDEPTHLAVIGNPPVPLARVRTMEGLSDVLPEHFEHVLDPFAGFGRYVRPFHDAGKGWTALDINPRCIGRIVADLLA